MTDTAFSPTAEQRWILARINPDSPRDISSRADVLWGYGVLYRKHGVRKPSTAYRGGEPVHRNHPLALTCWIWANLDPRWAPPTSTAPRDENVEWLRDRDWADESIFDKRRRRKSMTADEQGTLESG